MKHFRSRPGSRALFSSGVGATAFGQLRGGGGGGGADAVRVTMFMHPDGHAPFTTSTTNSTQSCRRHRSGWQVLQTYSLITRHAGRFSTGSFRPGGRVSTQEPLQVRRRGPQSWKKLKSGSRWHPSETRSFTATTQRRKLVIPSLMPPAN